MKWLLSLVLIAALAGCDSGVDISQLEQETLRLYNERLEQVSSPTRATSVKLSHVEGNQYTGVAEMNNGLNVKISATYDGRNLIFNASL